MAAARALESIVSKEFAANLIEVVKRPDQSPWKALRLYSNDDDSVLERLCNGLVALGAAQDVQEVHADGASITDEGLKQLQKLPQVKRLYLSSTQVSDVGLERLQGSRPGLRIIMLGSQKYLRYISVSLGFEPPVVHTSSDASLQQRVATDGWSAPDSFGGYPCRFLWRDTRDEATREASVVLPLPSPGQPHELEITFGSDDADDSFEVYLDEALVYRYADKPIRSGWIITRRVPVPSAPTSHDFSGGRRNDAYRDRILSPPAAAA